MVCSGSCWCPGGELDKARMIPGGAFDKALSYSSKSECVPVSERISTLMVVFCNKKQESRTSSPLLNSDS